MPTTQIADVVVPQIFTNYQIENSVIRTAVFQSGILAKNAVIVDQLGAGATQFTVPFWRDLPDTEADVTSDPAVLSVPQKDNCWKAERAGASCMSRGLQWSLPAIFPEAVR